MVSQAGVGPASSKRKVPVLTPERKLVLSVFMHLAILVIGLIIIVFYFFPGQLVFGIHASAAIALILGAYNIVAPRLNAVYGLGDHYFRFIVASVDSVFKVSVVVTLILGCLVCECIQ